MKAVLLAAGTSTRLRPLTDHTPKCLLEVAGRTLLRRAVDHLRDLGPLELVVVTGYLEGQIHDALRGWYADLPVTFVSNPAYATTNNGASLLLARPHVEGEEFLLLDSDIVFDRGVVEKLLASERPDTLALRPAADLGAEEIKCELDADGRVLAIGKTVPPERARGESIGIERFSPAGGRALFAALADRVERRGLVNEFYEASFQQAIEDGSLVLHAVDVGGLYCSEIDTAADLAAADDFLRSAGSTGDPR